MEPSERKDALQGTDEPAATSGRRGVPAPVAVAVAAVLAVVVAVVAGWRRQSRRARS